MTTKALKITQHAKEFRNFMGQCHKCPKNNVMKNKGNMIKKMKKQKRIVCPMKDKLTKAK